MIYGLRKRGSQHVKSTKTSEWCVKTNGLQSVYDKMGFSGLGLVRSFSSSCGNHHGVRCFGLFAVLVYVY